VFPDNLRTFNETVRAGSIRGAADALGVAPSSVSRQIAMLERRVGTALFERRPRGVVLTHAGRLVSEYAHTVLIDFDTLRTDLDDVRGSQRRLLRIALVESAAGFGLVGAVARFRRTFPAVSFQIRLMPAPQVIEAVRRDQCDIGIAFCPEPDPRTLTLASLAEPIVLVVDAGHPLASCAAVEIGALEDLALALPDVEFGVRQILDRAAAAHGFRLTPVLSSNVFETLRDFVRCGAGAAVLPRRAAPRDGRAGGLTAIPIAGAEFLDATIDVLVLRKRRLPRVVKAFAETLIAEMAHSTDGIAPAA
jgi:DNA-binding transcriptional LysR family regulator